MLKKIKKVALASVAGFVLALSIGWLPGQLGAVYNQYQATKYNDVTVANLLVRDSGLYDSGGTLRLTLGSTVGLPSGQLAMGSTTVAIGTVTTSGTSNGHTFPAYMNVGGSTTPAALEGSVLCASTVTALNNLVTVNVCGTQTLGWSTWVGIAQAPASTGTVVNVYNDGWVLARTTGTVSPGDQVWVSTQSAGYLEKTTVTSSGTVVGVALSAGNQNGGLTRIKIR